MDKTGSNETSSCEDLKANIVQLNAMYKDQAKEKAKKKAIDRILEGYQEHPSSSSKSTPEGLNSLSEPLVEEVKEEGPEVLVTKTRPKVAENIPMKY